MSRRAPGETEALEETGTECTEATGTERTEATGTERTEATDHKRSNGETENEQRACDRPAKRAFADGKDRANANPNVHGFVFARAFSSAGRPAPPAVGRTLPFFSGSSFLCVNP